MSNTEVLQKVEEGYRMTIPQGCPAILYEIMLQLINLLLLFF
jgi:hypothetical protein